MVVVGVQDLHDILCQVLLLYRLVIIAPVKGSKLEICDRLRIPDAQGIDYVVAITDDGHIIRHGAYRLKSLLDKFVPSGLGILLKTDGSAETDFLRVFRTAQFKWIAFLEPVVRRLYLVAVADLLLEHTVAVTDTAPISGIIQGCQRIHETCRQPSESAVSKRRIRLLVFDDIEIQAHFLQRFLYLRIGSQVDQVVAQGAPHQELHGHVIHGLCFLVRRICVLGRQPVVDNLFLHRIADSLKYLLLGCLLDLLPVKCLYIILYCFLKCFLVKSFSAHWSVVTSLISLSDYRFSVCILLLTFSEYPFQHGLSPPFLSAVSVEKYIPVHARRITAAYRRPFGSRTRYTSRQGCPMRLFTLSGRRL